MKHLKKYETWFWKKEKGIDGLCKKYKIHNYTVNTDGSIDVNEDVKMIKSGLSKIPIKFNRVNGLFSCINNKLITLENSPTFVDGGAFACSYNKLKTLLGGPKRVSGMYLCNNNDLKDVYGFPEIFNDDLLIDNNPICEILELSYHEDKSSKTKSIASRATYDVGIVMYPNLTDDEKDKFMKIIRKPYRFIRSLNEYQVIRNGNTIIQDRLEEALKDINQKLPENLEFKNYKII